VNAGLLAPSDVPFHAQPLDEEVLFQLMRPLVLLTVFFGRPSPLESVPLFKIFVISL